jgi:signal transduction histidine kinase
MASHEFRTPLATILATTETLSIYRNRLTEEQIERRFSNIRNQVSHLQAIMEDVLQLARIQAGRIDFKAAPLDLDVLCRVIIDELLSQYNRMHEVVYTSSPALPEVIVDKKLMRNAISNILSNAMKYSAAGTTIVVNLAYTESTITESTIELSVRDEGIGIPEADLKHLFEPFHRAENVGTISGTGLGLSITKESIELHGGTIRVESQVGVGTTFTLIVPLISQGASDDGEHLSH